MTDDERATDMAVLLSFGHYKKVIDGLVEEIDALLLAE